MVLSQFKNEREQAPSHLPGEHFSAGPIQIEELAHPPLELSDLGGLGQSHVSKPLLGPDSLVASIEKAADYGEDDAARNVLNVESCSSLSSNA